MLVDVTGPTDAAGDPIRNPAEVIEDVFEVYGDIGPKRGLAAWWKMDEKEGTVAEDSADDSPGVLEGDAVFREGLGKIDGCVDLPGNANDQVRVANTAALQAACTGDMSVAFWWKMDQIPAVSGGILSKKLAAGGADGFMMYSAIAVDRIYFRTDGTFAYGSYAGWDTSWHHVVAVILGATVSIYVDGVALTMIDNTANSPVGNMLDLVLGWAPGVGTPWLNGQLDDVRIYDRVLNVDEIAALATAPRTHVDFSAARTSLANWRMNFAHEVVTPLRAITADLAWQARSRVRWLDDDP